MSAWLARIAASQTEVHHIQLDDFGDEDASGVPMAGIDTVRWSTLPESKQFRFMKDGFRRNSLLKVTDRAANQP